MATLGVGRLKVKQAVELALERARVRLDSGIGEIGAAATDLAGALQECLEWRGEHTIAGIDSVLRVAGQVGKAELVLLGVIALRGKAIGDPHLGPRAVEELLRHDLSARRRNQVND